MFRFDEIAPDVTVDNVSDDHIEKYIKSIIKPGAGDNEPALIRQALSMLSFPTSVSNESARITTYCGECFDQIEEVGYGKFREDNTKHTISLLLKNGQPGAIRWEMLERLKVEPEMEKNVRRFIKRLKPEAKACQAYGPLPTKETAKGSSAKSEKGG